MIVILGLDGLEINLVEEFDCKHLKQVSYGKTDFSEFSEPRTIVLWAAFLTGKNLEKRILSLGKEKMWEFKLKPEETFFSEFKKWEAIDVPAFTYKTKLHSKERKALKGFFEEKVSLEEYEQIVFEIHRENKKEFFEALSLNAEIVMGYFNLADSIGHLSFGDRVKMRVVYKELDEIAEKALEHCEKMLIVSDHGMKAVGRFGDHSNYGFWSMSVECKEKIIKLTKLWETFYSL